MFLRRPPLRPFWGSKQPKCEIFHFLGPFWPPLSPRDSQDGPNGIKNTSTQCTWVGCIHIMQLGPLMDLYGTPGAPKGLILAPKGPCGVPRGPRRAPGGPDLVPTAPNWFIWVELMVTTHFDLVSGPFWAPRALKGPVLAQNAPFGDLRGPWRAPGDQIWSQLPPIGLPGLDSWSPHSLTWYWAPYGPPGALKGPILAQNVPFGDFGGPLRAPGEQIWSQLPPMCPPG